MTTPARRKSAKLPKAHKADEFAKSLHDKADALGFFIGWEKPDDAKTYKDVLDALDAAGLDKAAARELAPRFAFTRAAKKLSDDQVIDVLSEDATEIRFQVTRRLLQKEQWDYKKETVLTLNKTTGKLECEVGDLKKFMQAELDNAIDRRTTSDITKIVQRLFDDNADLMPFLSKGGVYIVPKVHEEFLFKIETFFSHVGGTLKRCPIPSGNKDGIKTMCESTETYIGSMIGELDTAVAGFGTDTRSDTLKRSAERVSEVKVKIKALAHYLLSGGVAKLEKALEDSDKKLEERINLIAKEKAAAPEKEKSPDKERAKLYGHSVSAVIRWMAVDGWTKTQIHGVLEELGHDVKPKTVDGMVWGATRTKHYAAPAELTKEQIDTLRAHKDKLKESK
jgi:hypothetical protein